jgi:hypothetical protein
MTRPQWVNLNGGWDYALLPKNDPAPERYEGQILVPYALESLLSGVQRPLLPGQHLWYHRCFSNPLLADKARGPEERVLLHFGAVDYQCDVYVNGTHLGGHSGGYLPFTFDITDTLILDENELTVSVWDPGDRGLQQRGKQALHPKGIWYTAVSGIWQTVWLEVVPAVSIDRLRLTPDLDDQSLTIEVQLRGADMINPLQIVVDVFSNGQSIASGETSYPSPLKLAIANPIAWSPATPYLYDLQVRLVSQGIVLDAVGSYFAMRKFGLVRDTSGQLRFALNNQPLFLYGPLDQGYFPDGLYTPPSEEGMLYDIEYARRIGCNMIRKHVKVEPLRWYYHCDRLGMIVCQDMPNGGKVDGDMVAMLALFTGFHRNDTHRLSRFGRGEEANRAEFRAELQQLIDHLYNAACIAVWVPFNESWGQFDAQAIGGWVRQYDPTRLVDHVSGWFDQSGGDFQSKHIYFKKLGRPKPDQRAFFISEFGGFSLTIPGHVWDENKKFGYRFYPSSAELTRAYLALVENELMPLVAQGLSAAVYTQTTDVEIEINGFLTYDRQIEKLDAPAISRVHRELITLGSSMEILKQL